MATNGYTKTILVEGTGPEAGVGAKVSMHYTGWLKDASQPDGKGKKFDSSVDREQPFDVQIGVGGLIEGWDTSVPYMKVGEKARLDIISTSAYGSRGVGGGLIPPNADLIFDVELLKILRPAPPPPPKKEGDDI